MVQNDWDSSNHLVLPAAHALEVVLVKPKREAQVGRDVFALGQKRDGRTLRIQGLGDYPLNDLRPRVETFVDQATSMVNAGIYSPVTVNGWLTTMRTMSRAAALSYGVPDFMEGVDDLDTSEVETYPDGSPNALAAEEVPRFLALMREYWPQHYAMVLLGTVTGQRPSTLRAIRRTGPESDVLWD